MTSNGTLEPGDPGYVEPGKSLMSSSSLGVNALTPGPSVTTYNPAQSQAKTATATGYDPLAYNVTPDQTVAEQVRKVVGENSPLIQLAESRALQRMNDRGLQNSSLALGEAQKATYDTALPIATADAAAAERAATNTTNAALASRAFKSGAENTASGLNAQLGTNVELANMAAINLQRGQAADNVIKTQLANIQRDTTLTATDKNNASAQLISQGDNTTKQVIAAAQNASDLSRTQLTIDNQLAIAKIDQNTKQYLGLLDVQNRQLLQENATFANLYQETVKNIAAIATNATMSPEAKQAATASQIQLLNEGLKTSSAIASTEQAAVGKLNLEQYFAGSGGLAVPTASVTQAQAATQDTTQAATSAQTFQGPNGELYSTVEQARAAYNRIGEQGPYGPA